MATTSSLKWSDLQTIFAATGKRSEGDELHFCFNCRRDGHTASNCKEPKRCYICLKSVHESYQCIENPVPGSIEYRSELRCGNCGERGHEEATCKSVGGVMHLKTGILKTADTVFPKPMILHVPSDDGPTDAELRECRNEILSVLQRSTGNPAAQEIHHTHATMRDVEFFCAVLPLLNDPESRWSANDHRTIKEALFRMRGAVAGSITLGDPSKLKGRRGASGVRYSSHQDDGDTLYDMKTSGLDINILVGGRLEVFRRHKSLGGPAASARGSSKAVAAAGAGSGATEFVPPAKVVEDCVYLSTFVRRQASAATASRAQAKSASQPPPTTGASQSAKSRVAVLVDSLAAEEAAARSPDHAKRTVVAQASKGEVPQPLRTSRDTKGTLSSIPVRHSAGVFFAPVPPHLRAAKDVAAEIVAEWANKTSCSQPETATTVVSSPRRPHTAATGGQRSVVRSFMQEALLAKAGSVQGWSSSSSSTQEARNAAQSAERGDGPITSWSDYCHRQAAASTTTNNSPTSSLCRPPSECSATVHPEFGLSGVPRDLVALWRQRFDGARHRQKEKVRSCLRDRGVYRRVVASERDHLDELANQVTSRASTPRSHGMPTGSVGQRHATAVDGQHNSDALDANLWAATCRDLANREAKRHLRSAVAQELRAYASRSSLLLRSGEHRQDEAQSFLTALCGLVVSCETPTQFRARSSELCDANRGAFASMGEWNKLCLLASSLLQDADDAQVHTLDQ